MAHILKYCKKWIQGGNALTQEVDEEGGEKEGEEDKDEGDTLPCTSPPQSLLHLVAATLEV